MTKKINFLFLTVLLISFVACGPMQQENSGGCCSDDPFFDTLALTPPMGWNSYDNFNNSVKEDEFKANVDFLAANLKQYGWEYAVIDILWYMPANADEKSDWSEIMELDEYGRPIPSLDKFPSAKNGMGLKPMADYVHSKGLKFGLHIMRGITKEAVHKNLPVYGTDLYAQDIVNLKDTCNWYGESYGVNMIKEGAQEFYNSLFKLYAEWEVDFIKADDMTSPHHPDEIRAVHTAIKNSGRPMVLSLSPGPAFVGASKDLQEHANMWRISNDFWDDWKALRHMFDLCHNWTASIQPGHWPDADMLPLGKIGTNMGKPRMTNFTANEQYTMMTLWSIFRSPLMLGGNLPETDDFTMSLISNKEVLQVNQNSENNRELELNNEYCIYAADVPESDDLYVAIFNFDNEANKNITVTWEQLGIKGKFLVRDLWKKSDLGEFEQKFSPEIEPHGAGFFRLKQINENI